MKFLEVLHYRVINCDRGVLHLFVRCGGRAVEQMGLAAWLSVDPVTQSVNLCPEGAGLSVVAFFRYPYCVSGFSNDAVCVFGSFEHVLYVLRYLHGVLVLYVGVYIPGWRNSNFDIMSM